MENKPRRRLDFTKVDNVKFDELMNQHIVGVQQGFEDLTIALGELLGHGALAKHLNERLMDRDTDRNSIGQSLLDAAWRVASRRAERGSPSRT